MANSTSARRERAYRKVFLSEFTEAILAAIIVAVLLRVFVVSVYRVPTSSMLPGLVPGDFIVAWKTSYGVKFPGVGGRLGARDPAAGDVVIFQVPEDNSLYVKRVVAVPGDRVEIRNGVLLINDQPRTQRLETGTGGWEFFAEQTGQSTHRVMARQDADEPDFLAPQVIPPGHVFLLGDLRSESVDSRQWGPIAIDDIVARASFIGFSMKIPGGNDLPPETMASMGLDVAVDGFRADRIFRKIE